MLLNAAYSFMRQN